MTGLLALKLFCLSVGVALEEEDIVVFVVVDDEDCDADDVKEVVL